MTQAELFDVASQSIRRRTAAQSDDQRRQSVRRWLERAAYCDLMCNPLEGTLDTWALEHVRKLAQLESVRAQLVGWSTSEERLTEIPATFGEVDERMHKYVQQILDDLSQPSKAR